MIDVVRTYICFSLIYYIGRYFIFRVYVIIDWKLMLASWASEWPLATANHATAAAITLANNSAHGLVRWGRSTHRGDVFFMWPSSLFFSTSWGTFPPTPSPTGDTKLSNAPSSTCHAQPLRLMRSVQAFRYDFSSALFSSKQSEWVPVRSRTKGTTLQLFFYPRSQRHLQMYNSSSPSQDESQMFQEFWDRLDSQWEVIPERRYPKFYQTKWIMLNCWTQVFIIPLQIFVTTMQPYLTNDDKKEILITSWCWMMECEAHSSMQGFRLTRYVTPQLISTNASNLVFVFPPLSNFS